MGAGSHNLGRGVVARRGTRLAIRIGLLVLMVPAAAAFAQTTDPDPRSAVPPRTVGVGAVDTSQGGVGGTGLGKMSDDAGPGHGTSVSGPPGQGLGAGETKKPDVK